MLVKLTSIFGNKCPRCLQGRFFEHSFPFRIDFHKMNDVCSKCGQSYHLETGFYYGAMYTSYAVNVVIFIVAWIIATWVIPASYSVWVTVGFTMTVGLLMVPLTFRWSRLLWISFFVDADKKDSGKALNSR